MKAAALVLAFFVAAVQSLAVADCCCVLVCKHRNESCSDCKHEQAGKPAKDDCWKDKAEAPRPSDEGHAKGEKRCAHLEPSSEVLQVAAEAHVDPLLFSPYLPVHPVPPSVFPLRLAEGEGRDPPARHPHDLLPALLI